MTARLYKALPARRMCDLWAISAHVDPCVLLGHLRILTRAVNLASGRRTIKLTCRGRCKSWMSRKTSRAAPVRCSA
jgi:hypothetical protein